MAETPEKYTCATQDVLDSTLGATPISHLDSDRNGTESLVLGIGRIVPRWDVVLQPNRVLQYFVLSDTFESDEDAQAATTEFQAAADEWGALNIGLTIAATTDQAQAHFYVKFFDPNDRRNATLASAFFPNEVSQDVLVYKRALEPANLKILKNVFLHELGHVLGLRHEFAITGDAAKNLAPETSTPAVQFMESNYYSVMSYNFPPTIQQSDIDGVKAFYQLKNGEMINGVPVTDYVPTIRKFRRPVTRPVA